MAVYGGLVLQHVAAAPTIAFADRSIATIHLAHLAAKPASSSGLGPAAATARPSGPATLVLTIGDYGCTAFFRFSSKSVTCSLAVMTRPSRPNRNRVGSTLMP